MLSSSKKTINKNNKQKNLLGDINKNILKNLISRDLGLINSKKLIQNLNSSAIDEINLSKKRSFESQPHSSTWLNLDNVESR